MLPKIYLIVDKSAWLDTFFPRGLRLAQLRVKTNEPTLLKAEISRGLALARRHGATLVVNDHWQTAIQLGASFIHLGQEDLRTADIPAIRRAGLRLGVSTHTLDELALALDVDPDYVAFGPIFLTTLKRLAYPPQGIARISAWRRAVARRPLVAIGGIGLETADACIAAGADSLAVSTDILGDSDPQTRLEAWLAWERGLAREPIAT